jgi:hypothetical protein
MSSKDVSLEAWQALFKSNFEYFYFPLKEAWKTQFMSLSCWEMAGA